jgi:hypothetical protein
MIFAREVNGPLASLVKKLDEATVKNSDSRMGSFVVFLSQEEGIEKQVKDLAGSANLKKCVLCIDNPAGPGDYSVGKDADVIVVLYVGKTVKVNHAYKKGEFKESEIDKILGELPQILKK